MGTADIIPGISGGTIAFILGIYEELIAAIKAFDLNFLKLICQWQWKKAFQGIPWKFLGALFFGILSAIFLLSKTISWLLVHKPILINAFFFGLITATIPMIAKIIQQWNVRLVSLIAISAVVTFYFVGLAPVTTPNNTLPFLFLSGILAISAMILPGISGAFILVLLGQYHHILNAVDQRDFVALGIFALGLAVGILSVVRILSWLFNKYHDPTIAVLTGIIIGSLNKIWPWKETLRMMESSHGKMIPIEQINIMPIFNRELMFPFLIIFFGFSMALLLNRSPSKKISIG